MKNMKSNVGSFATAKLQVKMRSILAIIAIIAVIGFSMAACKEDDDNGGGGGGSGGSGQWVNSNIKSYAVTDGVAVLSSETEYNYTTRRYTSDTNYEYSYTTNTTSLNSTLYSSSGTDYYTRNGQNYSYTSEYTYNYETYTQTSSSTQTTLYDSAGNQSQSTSNSETSTTYTNGTSASSRSSSTTIYDSATGLTKEYTLNSSSTNTSGTTSTSSSEVSYTIQLLSDSGGAKTYKYFPNSLISNGTSADISKQNYYEYTFQDRRTLEQKTFTSAGVLQSRVTYTYTNDTTVTNNYDKDNNLVYTSTSTTTKSDNPIIRAKRGDFSLSSAEVNYPSNPSNNYTSYQTVEVLSDSATELVIRQQTFRNGVLYSQSDYTYIKIN